MDCTVYGAELWNMANEQVETTAKCIKTKGLFGVPYAIEGKITNNSDETVHDGRMAFKLFNKQGCKIGEATDLCKVLAPGETWFYKALITVNGFVTFRLADFTGSLNYI